MFARVENGFISGSQPNLYKGHYDVVAQFECSLSVERGLRFFKKKQNVLFVEFFTEMLPLEALYHLLDQGRRVLLAATKFLY
jgi:hypothetical protein